MAVAKQPPITPETSSGEGLDEDTSARAENKWKRFHPFRVVRKIFRRRVKRQGTGEETTGTSKKSWSTSELLSVQDQPEKYEVPSPPYKIGLSVSHDSIFSSESSNIVSAEEISRPQGSSLSVQHAGIKNMFKDELFSRVHARRDSDDDDDDDDDVGLPHSPCASPTTVDVLNQGLKTKSLKSQTTSSIGSLLSMGSSENDEDSFGASSSGNSSRMSLLERRSLDLEGEPELSQPVPLNHTAARHKIAVRPKRTHGPPQKRLKQIAASRLNTLPTTPEVTEDSGRLCIKSESSAMDMTITSSTSMVHEVGSFSSVQSHQSSERQISKTLISDVTRSSNRFDQEIHSEAVRFQSVVSSTSSLSGTIIQTLQLEKSDDMHFDSIADSVKGVAPLNQDINRRSQAEIQRKSNDFTGDEPHFSSDIQSNTDIDNFAFKNARGVGLFSSDNKNDATTHTMSENIRTSIFNTRISEYNDATMKANVVTAKPVEASEDRDSKNPVSLPSDLSMDVPPLCVSALIKSIEKSESVCKKESGLVTGPLRSSAKFESRVSDPSSAADSSEEQQGIQNSFQDISQQFEPKSLRMKSPIDVPKQTTIIYSGVENKRSSLELKTNKHTEKAFGEHDNPPKSPINPVLEEIKSPFEQNNLEMAIKHQLQHQKISSHHEKACSSSSKIIPGMSPEEESIMSNKYVAMQVDNLSDNDSRVVISHQVSDITEACNYVTVDETFNSINIPSQRDTHENVQSGPISQQWVSSLDVLSTGFDSNVSSITVNSKTYNHRAADDRVTVSVKSISKEKTASDHGMSQPKQTPEDRFSKHSAIKDKAAADSSKISLNQGIHLKPGKKSSPRVVNADKENKAEKEVLSPQVKTPESSKRLSVEIVPFSQRVKDRKYQPLSFANKEAKTETAKSTSSVTVERNLSERRVTGKGKDTDKSNNRHSFSGVIQPAASVKTPPVTTKKHPIKPDVKPTTKTEKLHYPVEIRIHKNKSFEKDAAKPVLSKGKVSPDKLSRNEDVIRGDTKEPPKSSKLQSEGPAKWEVKVQSTSSLPRKETVHITESKSPEPPAILSAQITVEHKSIEIDNKKHESMSENVAKNSSSESVKKDFPRKPLKDTPPSDEPEPELLRVFARRSIKQKHFDKDKPDNKEKDFVEDPSPTSEPSLDISLKLSENLRTPSPSTSSNISIGTPDGSERSESASPEIIKRKSKSFSEKEKPGPHYVKPPKEIVLNRRPSLKVVSPDIIEPGNFVQRQRLASEPEVAAILPPAAENNSSLRIQQSSTLTTDKTVSVSCRSEHLQRAASISISPSQSLSNGTSIGVDSSKGKENPDAAAPSWLQLAQQRRELREQRERLLLGSSTNSFLDAASKPSRSSKVWDMVNNFQKMQMT